MKNDWHIKKLGEICDFQNGFAFKSFEYVDSGYFVMRIGNVQDGYISLADPKYIQKSHKPFDKFILSAGDILVSLTGNVGRVGVIAENHLPAVINQRVARITPRVDFSIQKDFLFYFFRSAYFIKELIGAGHGAAQQNISTKDIENLIIPIPSLSEQKRIVKILDEAFEKIKKAKENAEKNLQNSKELFESYLQNVFANPGKDWEEKRLEELGQITSSKRIYKKEYVDNGVPFYRIKEIKELAHNKSITLELFISESRYKEIKEVFGIPKEGEILMTAVGTIGEIYVVKKDEKFYFKDGNILWFKDFDSVDPYFLKFVLMSFVEQINKLSIGSAYNALTIEKIEKHKIFIPKSINEQKAIVKKLDSLSEQTKRLEEVHRKKIADLEELKKSILNKAFTGEL